MRAQSTPIGDPAGPPPARQTETAAYILDMARAMAAMATSQDLEMLAYLLNMAALEAAEAQMRAPPVRAPEPAPPSGPDGAT
jgi:hypothetical protein